MGFPNCSINLFPLLVPITDGQGELGLGEDKNKHEKSRVELLPGLFSRKIYYRGQFHGDPPDLIKLGSKT